MAAITDAELAQARQRWEEDRAGTAIPASVRFDASSERVTIDLTNGASFSFPARSLQGMDEATTEQLSEVELIGETGLHWESLDADFTILGLMNGILGTKAFMDTQRG